MTNKLNVHDKTREIYGNEAFLVASSMDNAATCAAIDQFQTAWDNGDGFTFDTMWMGRQEDTAAEAAACAQQLQNKLLDIIRFAWLDALTRDEAVALRSALSKGRIFASIQLVPGLSLSSGEIADEWTKCHPTQPAIY